MKRGKKNRIAKPSKAQPFPAFRASTAITNPHRVVPKGMRDGKTRDKATIKRLNMYTEKPNLAKMRAHPTKPVRIQPDRRWFGNTRVLTQEQMANFRAALSEETSHPNTHILKRSKLPLALVKDALVKDDNAKLLAIEPFEDTFGAKSKRKCPNLGIATLEQFAEKAQVQTHYYKRKEDTTNLDDDETDQAEAANAIFKKGTSKRIWAELYKVIDCSDVIVQVVDARDPIGTRCQRLEKYIREYKQSKALILLINKCDLVPTWVTAAWIKHLNRTVTTVAFHASVTKPFGKNTLIQLLKQYSKLHMDSKHFSVGFIGFPNVGKSSVINTLGGKKNCKTAPIPGETRVWQYVCLTKRIHLIDCPGVVPADELDEADKIIKGTVRVERIADPETYIPRALEIISRQAIIQRYGIDPNFTADNFLKLVAAKYGKYKRGKVLDESTAARIVLYDVQRGKVPYYTEPPKDAECDVVGGGIDGDGAGDGVESRNLKVLQQQLEEASKELEDSQLYLDKIEPLCEADLDALQDSTDADATVDDAGGDWAVPGGSEGGSKAMSRGLTSAGSRDFLRCECFRRFFVQNWRPGPNLTTFSPFALRADPEIVRNITKLIAGKFEKSAVDIDADVDFLQELGADSLDRVEFLVALEEEYDINIPDYEFESLKTINRLAEYIERRLGR